MEDHSYRCKAYPGRYDEVISAIHKDKKQVGKELTAVLMKDDMKLQIVHDVKRDEIEEAITYVFRHLRENQ